MVTKLPFISFCQRIRWEVLLGKQCRKKLFESDIKCIHRNGCQFSSIKTQLMRGGKIVGLCRLKTEQIGYIYSNTDDFFKV